MATLSVTQKLGAAARTRLPLVIEVQQTGSEPIRLAADVTNTQARRVLRWARSFEQARDHRPHLTGRERDLLTRFAEGMSYKEVAADLGISIETVRTYVRSLYRKLGVQNVTGAVGRAFRDGLI